MFMPREVAVYEGRRKVLTATVDILGGISASAEALTPAANVVAVKDMHPLQIAPGVSQGHLIKQTYPVYPAVAKDAHVEGKVILKAIIGADGHIHDLEVVEASSPLLVAPAIRCVSQWQYKPYLLDGVPVEVETTINVIFQLSR
jgi:protein TonB